MIQNTVVVYTTKAWFVKVHDADVFCLQGEQTTSTSAFYEKLYWTILEAEVSISRGFEV